MGKFIGFLVLALCTLICEAAIFRPFSESHRSAALELLTPKDGYFTSLKETYEALRTFKVLGIGQQPDIKAKTCKSVVDTLKSPSSALKDLFQALRVNGILKCELNEETFAGITPRLKDYVNTASSLLDYYYSVGNLILIKGQTFAVDVHLGGADSVFRAIKALSQSDGRWRYSSNNPESSTFAAGIALESLAGVISLASSKIDHSLIIQVKNDISKLLDGVEKYVDGAYYFDEKLVDAHGHQSPLSASAAVVRGITTFAAASDEDLNLPGDKILGLARFFLGVGIPGNAEDLFYQLDALASLENNRVSIPLILSIPAAVLSLTRKDQLKVNVNTVLGSAAPSLSVKLKQIFSSGSKDASIIDQDLKFDPENAVHFLDALPENIDAGSHIFSFEIVLHNLEDKKIYATGGRTKVPIFVTGIIEVDHADVAVLDSDLGNDFLGLVEKFFYLSGRYDIELAVGDAAMENSFFLHLGSIELDLPEPPEKASRPPQQPIDVTSRFGPKAEISHIFRAPEKRPPKEFSLTFLAIVLLPFVGFLVGLLRLQVNVKNFPKASGPATFAILFHLGIAAVLTLYLLFWLKLNLFTTLKALGFIGIFLMFVGQRTLSHLASSSSKLKSA
ncbi:unnamed protein product [Withania somnifera]